MSNVLGIVIKEHKGYIKDYGFLSDLDGTTRYGVNSELIELLDKQGATIKTKFIEDEFIPPYIVNGLSIPKGLLQIIAEFQV